MLETEAFSPLQPTWAQPERLAPESRTSPLHHSGWGKGGRGSAPAPSAHSEAPPVGSAGPRGTGRTQGKKRHSLSPALRPPGWPGAGGWSWFRSVCGKPCCSCGWTCSGRRTLGARRAPARRWTWGSCGGDGWSQGLRTRSVCGGYLPRGPRLQGWRGDRCSGRHWLRPWGRASSWCRPPESDDREEDLYLRTVFNLNYKYY